MNTINIESNQIFDEGIIRGDRLEEDCAVKKYVYNYLLLLNKNSSIE